MCTPPLRQIDEAPLRVSPKNVVFSSIYLGAFDTAKIQLTNPSKLAHGVTLKTDGPFSIAPQVTTIEAGATLELEIRFTPTSVGTVRSAISFDDVTSVEVSGEGLEPLHCEPAAPCETVVFDAEQGLCVRMTRPNGASCTSAAACFVNAICSAGQCVGTTTSCDDSDACTFDACTAEDGCVHPSSFLNCQFSANPCLVPSCAADAGCGLEPAPDGTECGARTCSSADVCISGQCVNRPMPQNVTCSDLVYGIPRSCGLVDGVGVHARVGSIAGMVVDANGTLWLVDSNRVRQVLGNRVRTVAGGDCSSWKDGVGSQACFGNLTDIDVDPQGNLLVAEAMAIRKVSPAGVVTTLAGGPFDPFTSVGQRDGIGALARFQYIGGISMGPDGTLYVADGSGYHDEYVLPDGGTHSIPFDARIRRVTPLGQVTTVWTWDGGDRNALIEDVAVFQGSLYATGSFGVIRVDPDGGTQALGEACARLGVLQNELGCLEHRGWDVSAILEDGGRATRSARFRGSVQSVTAFAGRPDGGIEIAASPSGCGLWTNHPDGGVTPRVGFPIPSVDLPNPTWLDAVTSGPDSAVYVGGYGPDSFVGQLTDAGIDVMGKLSNTRLKFAANSLWASIFLGDAVFNISHPNDSGLPDYECGSPIDVSDERLICRMEGQLRRVSFDGGSMTPIAGIWGERGIINGPLGVGTINYPTALVGDGDGGFWFAEYRPTAHLRFLDAQGTLSHVSGRLDAGPSISDGPLDAASFEFIADLERAPDGTIYLADGTTVRKLSGGVVRTVAVFPDNVTDLSFEYGGALLVVSGGALFRLHP